MVVVEDAVASAGTGHEQGLGRMSRAGVELIGVKGLGYEMAQNRRARERLQRRDPTGRPGGRRSLAG